MTETQAAFIAELQVHAKAGNQAVVRHLAKVEAMTAAEWTAHKARLDGMAAKFAPAATRMARSIRR